MSSYKPYPKYKPSGVEWLGDVPEGWALRPLKYFATFRGGATPSKDNVEFWNGDIPWVSPKDMKRGRISDSIDHITEEAILQSSTSRIGINSLLMVVRSGILQHTIPVAINDVPVTLNQDMRAVALGRQCKTEFLYYWFVGNNAPLLLELGKQGATVESIEQEYLANTRILLPPLPEQHQIATFLDRECGKLDALQAKQERLIELLKEKRQALISHAVTKGLDPNANLKPSGVEWLGEVPEHWRVLKLMMVLRQSPRNGVSPPITSDGTTPTFSISAVRNGRVNIADNLKEAEIDSKQAAAFLVKRGDILTLRGNGNRSLVGTAGIVDSDPPEGCIFPDILMRLRPTHRMSPEMLVLLLNSDAIRPAIELAAQTASGVWKISGGSLTSIKIPLPPLAEQRAIVAHLDDKCGKIDRLMAKAERAIALLKERRSALISAVVTGKIDVRDVAADCIRQAQPL